MIAPRDANAMLTGDEWSSGSGAAHAWLHGLAFARANRSSAEPPSYDELMHRLHGPSGLWTEELGRHLDDLGLPFGQRFEYDSIRGCKYWDPMQCYTAPSWINTLVKEIEGSGQPLLILEVRAYLGAASIALANALSYQKRDGFVIAIDTWRPADARVGLRQQWEQYAPPTGAKSDATDLMYYNFLRHIATASPAGYVPSWIPRDVRGKPVTNATKQVVPFQLSTPRAKATAHWLGRKSWRPMLAYVNAPRASDDLEGNFKADLLNTWKLLACGGTMAGDAYSAPEVGGVVEDFAKKRNVPLTAFFVRAPGTRYEATWQWEKTEQFAARIAQFMHSNFTTWAMRGKPCKGGDAEDDSLPEVTDTERIPSEFDEH